jgi:hypothetical protein
MVDQHPLEVADSIAVLFVRLVMLLPFAISNADESIGARALMQRFEIARIYQGQEISTRRLCVIHHAINVSTIPVNLRKDEQCARVQQNNLRILGIESKTMQADDLKGLIAWLKSNPDTADRHKRCTKKDHADRANNPYH